LNGLVAELARRGRRRVENGNEIRQKAGFRPDRGVGSGSHEGKSF
jgi:hypothetical protein